MKWTKRRILFFTLQILCWYIAPLVFIILQYSTLSNTSTTVNFKINITGIVLLVLVTMLFKKLFLNKYCKKLALKIATFETQIETEVNLDKIITIENAIKRAKTIESIFNFVLPIIILSGSVYVCWALEKSIIKLMGVLGFITISYVAGEIFNILEILSIQSKHRGDDNG